MVYVDETGAVLESVDLSRGRLEDAEWIDHTAVEQEGHYEYTELENGCKLQTFVVDTPAQSAWREVTVQRYVLYTEEELELMNGHASVEDRVAALEAAIIGQ